MREFRKLLGQPCVEEAPSRLDVKVLGAGCAQCNALTQLDMEVLTELKLKDGSPTRKQDAETPTIHQRRRSHVSS